MIAVLGVGIFYVFVSWMAIAGTGPQQAVELARKHAPTAVVLDLPRLIREKLPNAVIITFWHIPWPYPDRLRICPRRREQLGGVELTHSTHATACAQVPVQPRQ